MTFSNAHALEASKSNAGQWMRALDLCRTRILDDHSVGPFDARELRVEVDIQFFLVALLRFYRSISVAVEVLQHDQTLEDRVEHFHQYIDIKRTMRNVGEHFDEYVVGSGHDESIDTRSLQVWRMETHPDNVRFTWLGETFDLKRTMYEATELWTLFLTALDVHRRDAERPDQQR